MPPLGPLVRQATHPDPAQRIQSAAALHAQLLLLRDEGRGRAQLSALVADAMSLRASNEAKTVVDS